MLFNLKKLCEIVKSESIFAVQKLFIDFFSEFFIDLDVTVECEQQ